MLTSAKINNMFETKKFIFLSRTQRIAVSFLLGMVLFVSIGMLIGSKFAFQDQEIKNLSIDLIKLSVTAWGAWGLILLYASANSFERIKKETKSFLEDDIPRAFNASTLQVNDKPIDPLNADLKLEIIAETHQTAIYKFTNGNAYSIHFYCKLNVFDLSILIYLPEQHEARHELIYEKCMSFLKESKVNATFMGVFASQWLTDKPKHLQIQIVRSLGEDFLFDAAKRAYVAGCIYGDMRAFLLRAENEDKSILEIESTTPLTTPTT